MSAAVLAALAAWYGAAGLPTPTPDPRLADAAHGVELAAAGIVDGDILPLALSAADTADAVRRLGVLLDAHRAAARVMDRAGASVRCPEDAGPCDVRVVLSRRIVALDAPPPLQADGRLLTLSGRISKGWTDPEVLVLDPAGRVADVPVRPGPGRRFTADVPLARVGGRHRVEILARGAQGLAVAALFTVWAGPPPLALPVVRLLPDRPLADLVAEDRAAAGVPRLERDPALDAAAQAHAREMLRDGWFGHVAPSGAGPTDRVAAAGVAARRVLENLSVAAREADAHAALMDSPGHRRNVLDPRVTHFGVGVAATPAGQVYVAALFVEAAAR